MDKKKKYPTDTEAGIRTITQIRNLPSCELTDEEFVKEFFERFQAKALLLTYVDENCQYHTFGRLKKRCKSLHLLQITPGKIKITLCHSEY